ncbi:M3 family metallopeptidase [Bacillus carboniphilus]|uniref:M3 family metallopeptidase n=1 Tax=Bacillus carboniphilus TaxID=86663 RepID=A0ABY9JZE4_9BACI|nr:M3 family metallopeptidase [Bacillus carboniphilus]WLR44144.1 M3 family metallopeptidase [Bacillus carboniphilus]
MNQTFFINGEEYSIGKVQSTVMENGDRELRRKLFMQSSKIAKENETLFRELLKIRNTLAQQRGFDNYYELVFNLKEINTNTYFKEMNLFFRENKRKNGILE